MQTAQEQGSQAGQAMMDPSILKGLKWRSIGPFRGGRVVAVAGDPVDPLTFYFGAVDGGAWKTTDGGLTWQCVSDGYFQMGSVGAIAVADSDPNVVYAGMGETTIRGNVSYGDGVYKSTDGGRSWQHMGLTETQAIAKIRIHPRNPDLVYVAALGHIFGQNEERGIFRSKDGGATWEKVLYRDERTGAIDLSMDATNPRILYAAMWEAERSAHTLTSGGPGSSIYRSTDGGDTWTELTTKKGLPNGTLGKIGVTVSPARPERVWGIIEAEKGGVYRSDDSGESWQLMTEDTELRQRPWYYMHIFADPVDPDTVYVDNLRVWKSVDGGKTYSAIATPHGDTHDLWIDPKNPKRMINGNDGGACVSYNGGGTWSTIYNQPTAQFYHVVTDNRTPYRVYGAQQDNSTLCVPSRVDSGAITFGDCYAVGGGESGFIAVRPDNPDIVYAGSYGGLLTRYDHANNQMRNISAWPDNPMGYAAKDLKFRFQWTYPIVLSPHDPNTLYVTSQYVHRTRNEGQTWDIISPDLTRNDASRMGDSGGPITHDNTSVEYYGTIFAFAESPVARGVLWTGSDDGLVHVSRDDGQNWQNVTPPDLPPWAMISMIEASYHDAGTAYVAATRYKLDDDTPYVYKTSDYGTTWTRIVDGIRENDFAHAVREDPNRRGLLYVGTETGAYVSIDDGARWQSLQLNLPVSPVHDFAIRNNDLVAATHGRSFWILDDLTPLYQTQPETTEKSAHLFEPPVTIRWRGGGRRFRMGGTPGARAYQNGTSGMVITQTTASGETEYLDAGSNPPDGLTVSYFLKEKPEGEVKLTFLDAAGNEIKSFTSKEPEKPDANASSGNGHGPRRREPKVPSEAGLNRFTWNLRYPNADDTTPSAVLWAGALDGPVAPPGRYTIRLEVGDQSQTVSAEVVKDPRAAATPEELQAQFELLLKVRDKVTAAHRGINQARDLRKQIEDWEQRAESQGNSGVTELAQEMKRTLSGIEEELIQVRSKSMEDPLNYPIKLNNKLAALGSIVGIGDWKPTGQAEEVYAELSSGIDAQLDRLHTVLESDVREFNAQIREADLPAITPKEEKG